MGVKSDLPHKIIHTNQELSVYRKCFFSPIEPFWLRNDSVMTAWWMSEGNNPVGKLLRFAEGGARIQGTMTTNDAWAAIFGCHIVDTLKIARGISDIYELVQAG